jgi:hypothetical protein
MSDFPWNMPEEHCVEAAWEMPGMSDAFVLVIDSR